MITADNGDAILIGLSATEVLQMLDEDRVVSFSMTMFNPVDSRTVHLLHHNGTPPHPPGAAPGDITLALCNRALKSIRREPVMMAHPAQRVTFVVFLGENSAAVRRALEWCLEEV